MRELKFRAWDKWNKEMVYNVNLNDGRPVKRGFQWFNPQNTVHDAEPMQYTGLHDKNGKEIYEGDIVHLGDRNIRYTVAYRGSSFVCKQHGNRSASGLDERVEVIGNIYESPELLGEAVQA